MTVLDKETRELLTIARNLLTHPPHWVLSEDGVNKRIALAGEIDKRLLKGREPALGDKITWGGGHEYGVIERIDVSPCGDAEYWCKWYGIATGEPRDDGFLYGSEAIPYTAAS